MDFCLQVERLFAIYQMNKVLNFMGINYKDLYEVNERSSYLREQLYKENTHVFGYYILTAIFLNNYRRFITWCADNAVIGANNKGFMKFNCEEKNFQQFGEYITSTYKNNELYKIINAFQKINFNNKKVNKELLITTRMSAVDIKYIF